MEKIIRFVLLSAVVCTYNGLDSRLALADRDRPCSEDIANFCKEIEPGGGRIISCLKRHEAQLSPPCRTKLQEVLERIEKIKQVCTTDIDGFCKGIEPGEGRIARCLEEHRNELTSACRAEMEWVKARLKTK